MLTHVKKTLFGTVCGIALSAISVTSAAETTLVLELQEELSRKSEVFGKRIDRFEKLSGSRDEANRWYKKAMKLPEESMDYKHAVAKYVATEARTLEPMAETIVELEEINDSMGSTLERLIDALAEERANKGFASVGSLSEEELRRTARNMSGFNSLMRVLALDPDVSSSAEFGTVYDNYRFTMTEFLDEGPVSTNLLEQLSQVAKVVEAQGVLIGLARKRLRVDYNRLQALNMTGTSTVIAQRVQQVLAKLTGLFNGDYGRKSRRQTQTLMRKTRHGWAPSRNVGKDLDVIGRRLDVFSGQGMPR